jgi:competence protein ComEC
MSRVHAQPGETDGTQPGPAGTRRGGAAGRTPDGPMPSGSDRVMSDRAVVALAVAAAAGARLAAAVPVAPAVAFVVVVVALRRPWLLVLGVGVLASSLGARSWHGLTDPATGPVGGWATLVSDPQPTERGVSVDLRLDGDRYRAIAFGSAAGQLRLRAAGESVEVEGSARRPPPDELAWLAPHHIGARLDVASVGDWSPGGPATRAATLLRRTLDRGSTVMSDDHRALFVGFVLGDDRQQRPQIVDEFRASGLSHLLAVSGQNVAFVLAIVSPVLRRLALGSRFVATVAVIAFFALVTRFEPSVLRASTMAGMAALATTLGREASGIRLLALAVAGLLLVDPILVHSLGFGLSIAASAGILILGPIIAGSLPGPTWFTSATGITLGAQLGVAPLLVPAFGGLPLAALPANLLAAPAAGPLVAWGMTAGVIAGWLHPLAELIPRVLHVPTDLLIGWIAGIAGTAASLPLGELRLGHLVIVAGVVSILLVRRSSSRASARTQRLHDLARSRLLGFLAVVVLAIVVATAVRSAMWPAAIHAVPADGAELWIDGRTHAAVLVLDGQARASPVLEGLRSFGVRRMALLVVTTATTRRAFHETVIAVTDRYRPPVVVVPAHASPAIAGATLLRSDTTFTVGDLAVVVETAAPDRIDVHELGRPTSAGRDRDLVEDVAGSWRRSPSARPSAVARGPPNARGRRGAPTGPAAIGR